MQDQPLIELAKALGETRRFLANYGNPYVVLRLASLEKQAEAGDKSCAVSAFTEATGGMGSLNDVSLYPYVEGPPSYRNDVDRRFRALIKVVEQHARAAATVHGIDLGR